MTPRATLLGLLVASAAFAIAAADKNMTRCLLDHKTIVLNFTAEYGESKIKVIDLISDEKLLLADVKTYNNPRARNPIQKPRMLIVVHIKCLYDTKELLKELVQTLIKNASEHHIKMVIDGRNVTQLGSIQEYTKEASHKVKSMMNIQLKEDKSRSQAIIISKEDAKIKNTEHCGEVFTKNINNEYITKNSIEQVITLKKGDSKCFIEFIEISWDAKKYIREDGACIIGSTDIQCKDKEETLNNKTTPSGIMYVDNGTTCTNISCPSDYKMVERNCTDGALTGPGHWCRGKQKCDDGSQEIGDYCYRLTNARKQFTDSNQCGNDHSGYIRSGDELMNNSVHMHEACKTKSGPVFKDSGILFWTTLTCQSVDNGVLTLKDGNKYDQYHASGYGDYAEVKCDGSELEISCSPYSDLLRYHLCVKSRIIL